MKKKQKKKKKGKKGQKNTDFDIWLDFLANLHHPPSKKKLKYFT